LVGYVPQPRLRTPPQVIMGPLDRISSEIVFADAMRHRSRAEIDMVGEDTLSIQFSAMRTHANQKMMYHRQLPERKWPAVK
jgi:hypothetical protein